MRRKEEIKRKTHNLQMYICWKIIITGLVDIIYVFRYVTKKEFVRCNISSTENFR